MDEFEELLKVLSFLKDKNDFFTDSYNEVLELSLDKPENLEGYDIDLFYFEEERVKLVDLLKLKEEIFSLEINESNSIIRTKNKTYFIIGNDCSFEAQFDQDDFRVIKENYNISTINYSIIVGIAAILLGEYHSDYWFVASQYTVVEVSYENKKLTHECEIKLLTSYLFEIADKTGHSFQLQPIKAPEEYHLPCEEFNPLQIIDYNEGMDLFLSAVQIHEPALKFLNFYKVLEFFSPVAANLETYNLMRMKLDSAVINEAEYIKDIIDLAVNSKDRFTDEGLIITSFNKCFDFIGLSGLLPISIIKNIKKTLQIEKIDYSLNDEKNVSAKKIAARIIYSTRNQIVHAKSNFSIKGNEVPTSELDQLNEFMKASASQAIRWYSRLPNHQKLY